jgi:putative membrane protein
VLAGALVALVLTFGGSEEPAEPEAPTFITRMTSLDARTLALARVGEERASRPETKLYAQQAVTSLSRELEELDRAHVLIFGEEPATRGKTKPPAVRGSDFDRAFIDALVAGHEEAIRIAQQEIERGEDPDLAALAESAIKIRAPQITSMRRFREDTYGSAGAAGGTP